MGTYRFKLPDIGEGVVEAEITAWHVALGDTVEEDQPLADAMTDKATIELTSPVDGVITQVACEEGETVAVGADLVVFETDADEGAVEDSPPAETESAPAQQGTYDFKLPDIGEGVVEAEITAWHVAVGDVVDEDDPLADAMTDKATIELTSPVAGTVTGVAGEEGDTIAVGAVLVRFAVEGDAGNRTSESIDKEPSGEVDRPAKTRDIEPSGIATRQPVAASPQGRPRPLASPAVRKRARDAGLDLSAATPTGAEGNVTHADLDLLETALLPVEGETRIKVIGLRRKIAQSMEASKRTIAHFTYVDEIDVTELEAFRKRANTKSSDDKPKLTVLPFIIRALAATLQDWPQFNAHYRDGTDGQPGGFISQFVDLNLGLATQTDTGLVVPVIQKAQTLTIWEMAAEIARLANGARDNKLSPADFQGATTTLTSLGPLGGIVTTPVVNKPEVAIFGPNKIRSKLELRDGDLVERKVMNFSVSADHRVIDGYDAAAMVQDLKARLEDPVLLFL
jgi:2-oxoisovalerate dehydrogenase E2 component (dihydrolipoyl transacylase)